MKHFSVSWLLLGVLLCVQGLYVRNELEQSVIGVELSQEKNIVQLELSRSLEKLDCQRLQVTTSNQVLECSIIQKISSRFVECEMPLIPLNVSNNEEFLPQSCQVKCGELCNELSSPYQDYRQLAVDPFSFIPSFASFIYPSYLAITLNQKYDTIKSVYLQNDKNTVEAFILRQNSTLINALIKGGAPGDYTIKLKQSNDAILSSSTTISLMTKAVSVSPAEGSIKGGVILNIVCANCSPRLEENIVTIGSATCNVIKATPSLLTCITQVDSTKKPDLDTPIAVKISNSASESSIQTDTDSPKFTFKEYPESPTISSIGSHLKGIILQGETVVISGTDLQIPEETTVLRIGEEEIEYQELTPLSLSFQVPFDMTPRKQLLTIHVGKRGATSPANEVYSSVKLISSQCFLQTGAYNYDYQQVNTDDYLYFDMNLSNYDPSYSFQVTLDDDIIQAKVTQSANNKNYVNVRLPRSELQIQSKLYSNINKITISGQNAIETPIPLTATAFNSASASQIIISSVTYSEEQNGQRFVITVLSDFDDLAITRLLLVSEDRSIELEGSASQLWFYFTKLSYDITYYLQGCSNHGTIYYELPELPSFAFYSVQNTWELVDAPFPDNVITPGQTFNVRFSSFDLNSDFLNLSCDSYSYPLFWTDSIEDNIFSFEIPPMFFQTYGKIDFGASKTCYLTSMKGWSIDNDKYVTRHIFEDNNNFSQLQTIISKCKTTSSSTSVFYQEKDNIVIKYYSKETISYLGGEELILYGNLKQTTIEQVAVKINGIACSVVDISTTQIKCVTGTQPFIQLLDAPQVLVYQNNAKALVISGPISIYFRQVDPIPFYGFLEFQENSKVYIPKYNIVYMDDETALSDKTVTYDRVLVDGQLIFEPTMNYSIICNQFIGQGSLVIGSEASPFKDFKITFKTTQTFDIQNLKAYGYPTSSIMKLSASALKGTKQLSVNSNALQQQNLKIGDQILVSGTTIGSKEELLIIESLNADSITVTTALQYDHIVINENITLKDKTVQSFKVAPSLLKHSKTIVFNLINKNRDTYIGAPISRTFDIHGVEFYLTQQQFQNNYAFTLIASTSILDVFQYCNLNDYSQQNDFRMKIQSLDNSLFYDFNKDKCLSGLGFTSVATNNLFIGRSQYILNLKYSSINFSSNSFQTTSIYLRPYGQTTTLTNNLIYNTDYCLNMNGYYQLFSSIELNNNLCFSCNTASSVAANQRISRTSKYSLIAMEIQKVAVEIFSFEDDYQNIQDYGLISLGMVFKAVAEGKQNDKNPLPFFINTSNRYEAIGISDVEYLGFQGKIISSNQVVEKQNMLQLNAIENGFSSSSVFLAADSKNLIVYDKDGSLLKNNLKGNNIFSDNLNLQSSSSCQVLSSGFSVCQNSLFHFQQFYLLRNLENANQLLKFKRTNGKIIDGFQLGFYAVNGESYEVSIVDDQNKALSLNTFSSQIDFKQNDSLGILLNFQIKERFIDYFITGIAIISTEQLADITSDQLIASSTALLKLDTCTHGQNSDQGTFVQVCYKYTNSPLTVQFLFTPDVVPQISLETVISTRNFEEPTSWVNALGKSTQTNLRWTIQSNWNMILSKGGVYDVPSLVVQGTLEITGNQDITINTKGIYIGAGVIKVSSTFTGKLLLNFKITDPSEIIFRNPFVGAKEMYQGTFAIFNKFIIENTDADTVPYRIKSVIDENTLLLEDSVTLAVGLDVIFACPITGQTIQSSIKYTKRSGSGTLVQLQVKHGYTFAGFEKITVSSSQYKLSPYLRVLNKRIHISNANFIIENYALKYIPQISISGVQFENSSIILKHGLGDIQISSSNFLDKSADLSGSKDFFIFIDTIYNYYYPQFLNPSVKIAKNVFFGRNKIISINQMMYFSANKDIRALEKDMKVYLTLEFTGNFVVNAATAVDSSLGFNAFSDNTFIKASESCVTSPVCFKITNNQFFQCAKVAINIQSCKSIGTNLIAMSGVVYSSQSVTSIDDIVSIGNGKLQSQPISVTGGTETLPKLRLTITNSYFVGDVNSINPTEAPCVPNNTLLSLFADSASKNLAVPEIIIKDTFFAYFQCTKLIQIPSQDYLSSLSFVNAKCLHCGYNQLSDVLDISPGTISSSLLIQDYKSSFFQKIPFALATSSSKQTVITQISESPFVKLSQTSGILSRLFITQLKTQYTEQTFTAEDIPSFNNQNLQAEKGAALILPINKMYNFKSSTILEKNAFRLSSPNVLNKEYIQLKYKPQEKNGLMVEKLYQTMLPTPGLDTTKGFAILDMVQHDESQINCGTMAYDIANDEYHIIITNDDDCLIRIFEYAIPKISIVISTPILPPPPPEQKHLCLAERQRLYVIDKLSAVLDIPPKRIRVLSQSNSGSCSLSKRFLADGDSPETLSFTIVIDSESNASDSTTQNCRLNPDCTGDQKLAQDQLSQADNLAIFYKAEQIQVKALEKGLVINSVQATLPSLTTTCGVGEVNQEGVCKTDGCDDGFFQQGNFCIKCHSSCQTCTGQSDHDCKDSTSVVGDKDCAKDYKTFIDNSNSQKYCGKCPENCSTCLTSKCPVGSCDSGFVNQNGFCRTQCTSGYFNLQGICAKCQSNCSNSCSLGTCECSTGYFYKQSTTNPVCNACPSLCATCSSEKTCLTCVDTNNEPKLLCLTEKYIESAASTNSLGLIIGLTLGIGFTALIIGFIAKSQLAKLKLKKSTQLESVKQYTDTNALQPKEEKYKQKKDEIISNNKNNNVIEEEESPLGMVQI